MIEPLSGPHASHAALSGWEQLAEMRAQHQARQMQQTQPTEKPEATREQTSSTGEQATGSDGQPLDAADQRKVDDLKKRDQEVRTHEQAHVAAGGNLVQGGISFSYQMGPDGKRYAVGGEVQIDTSEGRTPEETVRKMQRVRSAALAPQQPSSQDLQVAAQAAQKEMMARMQMATSQEQEREQAYASVAASGQNASNGGGARPQVLAVA